MIHHISFAAHEPRHTAEVLADIMPGQVIQAPPEFPADSWFVLACDLHGTFVEVLPAGVEMHPGNGAPHFTRAAQHSPYSPCHALISTASSAERILKIGAREGWKTMVCNRGPFELSNAGSKTAS